MLEISISQISFKNSLGSCLLNIVMKCGERRESMKVQTTQGQKLIKYTNPIQYTFESSKYIQFFIETADESGYVKLLGSQKFVVADIAGKENNLKVELEYGNVLTLSIRCFSESEGYKRNSLKSSSQWTKSLRAEPTVTVTRTNQRYGSPQAKRMKSKSPPQILKMVDSGTFNKSSASSIKQQKVLEECKQFLQSNVLDESEEFHQSPDHRMETPQPLDLTRFDKAPLQETQSSVQSARQLASPSINKQPMPLPIKPQIYNEDAINFRQMAKELSLLLDVQLDRDAIVQAVQHLLQQFRAQGEQLLKTKCDLQIVHAQLDNLQQQRQILERKSEDFRSEVRAKLKTYKTLFEENVQLKITLKEDLQEIVNLHLQIKELKGDQEEKIRIGKEIEKLKGQIEKVAETIEQDGRGFTVFHEEINQIEQSQI